MLISRAARANCGVLLTAVPARTVEAGAVELDTVRAADGADDASVSAAEGAEDASVCAADADEDIDEAIVSGGVAAVAEELIVTEDAKVREEGILRAWSRSTFCRGTADNLSKSMLSRLSEARPWPPTRFRV
jgi:hypothetical protein